jgi:hypothetical protein
MLVGPGGIKFLCCLKTALGLCKKVSLGTGLWWLGQTLPMATGLCLSPGLERCHSYMCEQLHILLLRSGNPILEGRSYRFYFCIREGVQLCLTWGQQSEEIPRPTMHSQAWRHFSVSTFLLLL